FYRKPARGEGTMPGICIWAGDRGAMNVLADGHWKAVDCKKVVGGSRLEADVGAGAALPTVVMGFLPVIRKV
ncbi:hypothetical protein, partial [Acidithiobacillus sp.]|uniref:hypothetical protein n=1 Tax=Acidithiobacillus sp. TaxID=1872118 RepID=UPI003CFC8A7B